MPKPTLADRLQALYELQQPAADGSTTEAPPPWLRGPEDVLELALWGLGSEDPDLRMEAAVLGAWFRDQPQILAALSDLCFHPDDRLAMTAAVSAYDADPAATAKVEELLGDAEQVWCRSHSGSRVAQAMLRWVDGRQDPGALAVARRAADLGYDDDVEVYAQLLGRVGTIEQLIEEVSWGMGAEADAVTGVIALREEPQAVPALVEAMHNNDYFTERALLALADRADVAAIGPLLGHWEGYLTDDDENYESCCALVEGLAHLPGGRAELEGLAAQDDPAVATLARTFLVRTNPTPEGLSTLRSLLAETEEPRDHRYHPAATLLALDDPLSHDDSWPIFPSPRTRRWQPLWATMAPRDPAAQPVVDLPRPTRGWRWLPAPEARPGHLPPHWDDLPVVAEAEGYAVRWAGPLVDSGHAELFDAMTEGRTELYGDIGALLGRFTFPEGPFEVDGEVDPNWSRSLVRAAQSICESAHPSGVETWLAWLGFQLAGPHQTLKARARILHR